MTDLRNKRVTVTGGAGFLGRVLCDKLEKRGCASVDVPRRADYDLTEPADVARMYDDFAPDVVIHLAAEVGGIGANREHPGRFFYANAAMGLHLIEQGRRRGIEKFVQTGTVCAYPKFAEVPFREDDLWNGYPEETNAPYGIAKKSLFVMLDGYKREYGLDSAVVVPVNLYGPGDNFDLQTSHVIPALIRKCIEAQRQGEDKIVCWGTGAASREFLYVDDAAEGIVQATERIDDPTPINLGTGQEITIRELVEQIVRLTGFEGRIEWDDTKPDGQPRRCLDTTRARQWQGWQAQTSLEQGLKQTIKWFTGQTTVREVHYG
jgi:GDP-L-fucose synthase